MFKNMCINLHMYKVNSIFAYVKSINNLQSWEILKKN